LRDHAFEAIASRVRSGDVWVVNDAATLPASLAGRVHGREVELRLVSRRSKGLWRAVLFGEGSWRDDTDTRPAPPTVSVGDIVELGGALRAAIVERDPRSERLITVRFAPEGDAFWRALYRFGRPIQYSYVARELRLGEVQTEYASRPWSVELPSAGRPLSARVMANMRREGAQIVSLTHAAGISATGDPVLDALLPLPERYELSNATVRAVQRARDDGRRVVAVGTSTARALEGNVRSHGRLTAGAYETDLVVGPATSLAVVDALLTGAHDPTSSHYQLLRAFVSESLLQKAGRASERLGYLGHELGDSWLVE